MKYFSLDKTNVLRIIVTNSNGDDIITIKENLRSLNNPEVGWIPISVTEYKQSAKTLSEKDIENHAAQTFVTVATGVFERSLQAQPSSIYNYITAIKYEYSSSPVPQTQK